MYEKIQRQEREQGVRAYFRLFRVSKLIHLVISAATMVRNRPVTFIDPSDPEAVLKLSSDNFLVSSQLLKKFMFINGLLFFLNIFPHLIHMPAL